MQSAYDLLKQLTELFPAFALELDEPAEDLNFHGLMLDFLSFWGGVASTATEEEVIALAKLVNDAVDQGGDLENAMDTCFLEHLSQVRGLKPLKKHLSPAAKALSR